MGRRLVKYGPSAAFYIFALAAQVSGYTNTVVALLLAAIATLLLLFPGWHHGRNWRKNGGKVEPDHLIVVGLIGAVLSVAILAAGFIWQSMQSRPQIANAETGTAAAPARPAPSPPTQSPPPAPAPSPSPPPSTPQEEPRIFLRGNKSSTIGHIHMDRGWIDMQDNQDLRIGGVDIGKPEPGSEGPFIREQLLLIPKSKSLTVAYLVNDDDCKNFAVKVIAALSKEGYRVAPEATPAQRPYRDLTLFDLGDRWELFIGPHRPGTKTPLVVIPNSQPPSGTEGKRQP